MTDPSVSSLQSELQLCNIERRLYAIVTRYSTNSLPDSPQMALQHRLIQDYSSLRADYITNLNALVRRYEAQEEKLNDS